MYSVRYTQSGTSHAADYLNRLESYCYMYTSISVLETGPLHLYQFGIVTA